MKKWLYLIGAILVVGYLIMLSRLDTGTAPKTSDVIIVASGSLDGDRPQKASELLAKGYSRSDMVIVSPLDETNIPLYQQTSIEPKQIINDEFATSTFENATNTLAIMEERGYTSAIVVSSDYHMRRVEMIYERVNEEYGYDLTYVSAYHGDDQLPWYRASLPAVHAGMVEPLKHIGYLFGMYRIINL